MDLVRLTSDLAFLRFPVGHAYLWLDAEGVTVIDTSLPGSAPAIAEAVRSIGRDLGDVRQLILTHAHEDHVGSAAEIAARGRVAVLAHHGDAPVIRAERSGPSPVLSAWEQALWDRVHTQMPSQSVTPVRVDRELHDGDELDLGGGAVVVAAPGHTPGSVAIHLPRQRILFTADTVARAPDGSVILGVFNADPAQGVESMRRQAELDVHIACFGHGEPVTQEATQVLRTAVRQLR